MSKKLTATVLLLMLTFLTPQSTPIVVMYLLTNLPSQYLLIIQDLPVLASPIDINYVLCDVLLTISGCLPSLTALFFPIQQQGFQTTILKLKQYQIAIPMGNACCSDDTDRKTFDPTLKRAFDFQPSTSTSGSIKFPNAKLPKKNSVVEELNNEAGKFSAKNPLSIPSGTPSDPRALNKEGLIYYGEWSNGIPHGKGELFYPNGAYYTGYFNKGNADGQGRFISPEGWIYEGELENEQAEGKGILYHKGLKYKFSGIWSGDLPNGYGREQWQAKNKYYEGQFLNGKKHGEGKYVTPEFQYNGSFNDNQFDSFGYIKYENGQKYEGNFEKGKKNGKGVYTWTDGSYYEGFYKNDLKHGQGRYKAQDDSYWEGEWVYGKREGLGTLKKNNKKYAAQWTNGIAVGPNNKSQLSKKMSRLSVETFHA